jgi:hypothetical protein
MVLVMIGGVEFARFVRDEGGILGLFEGGKRQRFSHRQDAFEATVKQRTAREKLRKRHESQPRERAGALQALAPALGTLGT